MVRRTNLRTDPQAAFAELAKRLKAAATDKNTTPTGVKDLGARGDVVWTDADGNEVQSMRELGSAMGQVAADLSYLNGTILPSIKDATYIDDKSITTRLIAANAVGADQIIANSITGDKIRANSIAAEKILGGSFEGKQFVGGDFVGAIFRTSTTSVGGAIRIDKDYGIRGWDKAGTRTFMLDPDTGAVQIAATLQAMDSTGSGVMLEPKTALGTGGLFFTDNGKHNSNTAGVYRSSYQPDIEEPVYIRGANGGHVVAVNGLGVQGGGIVSDGEISSAKAINTDVGFKSLKGINLANPGTTSAATNMRITVEGNVREVTSSREFKRNIVPWSPAPERVLSLQPRQWQHDDPNTEDIDEGWHVGFVAEEVADAGLTDLVDFRGDGRGGWKPHALRYDRFAAAQQVVLQDHEKRIADLEAENTALRESLAALTARVDALTA